MQHNVSVLFVSFFLNKDLRQTLTVFSLTVQMYQPQTFRILVHQSQHSQTKTFSAEALLSTTLQSVFTRSMPIAQTSGLTSPVRDVNSKSSEAINDGSEQIMANLWIAQQKGKSETQMQQASSVKR
jgi:hypothetical protein